ncbi:MAG: hypothetical protein MJA29_14020 [Candidatus Omnitrophica bacterium]|nr:hypothetical protein [Candidatus Omnitrophota bacterium]
MKTSVFSFTVLLAALGAAYLFMRQIPWMGPAYALCFALLLVCLWLSESVLLKGVFSFGFLRALRCMAWSFIPWFILYLAPLLAARGELNRIQSIKLILGIAYVTFVYAQAGTFLFLLKNRVFQRRRLDLKRYAFILFMFVLTVYLALACWTGSVIKPTGDEPFYLLAAQSLIYDHDLDISNNYLSRQWRAYLPARYELSVWESPRRDGRIYLEERVLFILHTAFWYLIAGSTGVFLGQALVSSGVILLTFLLLVKAGFEEVRSFWISVLAAFCEPMITMSSRIYHNTFGALLAGAAFLCLAFIPRPGMKNAFLCLIPLLALPWFHTSYAALSLSIFALLVWKYRAKPGVLLFASSACFVNAFLFVLFRGHIREGASGLNAVEQYQLTAHVYRSLLALLFDQETGLFFHAPVYLLSFSGVAAMFWTDRARRLGWLAVCFFSLYLILQGSVPAFGGGFDTGRLLIPFIPFAALFLARACEAGHLRRLVGVLAALSLVWGYLLTAAAWLAVNYEVGRHLIMRQFARLGPDPGRFLPSFIIPGQEHYAGCALALGVVILLGAGLKERFSWNG